MYEKYFDSKSQEKMRDVFLQLSKRGVIKTYEKNSVIRTNKEKSFCIVVEGKLKQSINSVEGEEKILYILQSGEIFGEMDYFAGGENQLIVKTLEKSKISFINEEVMEKVLIENPVIYRNIIHSIIRKFRIVMFQMGNMAFADAQGKVADTIIRLYSQGGIDEVEGKVVNEKLTHEEIAKLIGCSRVTVTRALNKFKDNGLIEIREGMVIIKDIAGLKKYIKWR
ncbi:Crp/Fnr family transcriptional regulator [Tissierella sp. MSJ-40]|uniref:Crp/Fnr family transcriptional regulator n=1 Tax=Tissierella simiarum TaxID=2841534 RepID=A0ABS6E1C3_9FIRM|nr:Crp/Fnr family transcriptional regulator [Tissierella simiarum]MBU5436646.1 Crp/Fnr family transcriptional regulator [Tissierella simiarum]